MHSLGNPLAYSGDSCGPEGGSAQLQLVCWLQPYLCQSDLATNNILRHPIQTTVTHRAPPEVGLEIAASTNVTDHVASHGDLTA